MFDIDDFILQMQEVETTDKKPVRIPQAAELPPMKGGVSAGKAIASYMGELMKSPNATHREAAAVVGTVLAGLMRCNCARVGAEELMAAMGDADDHRVEGSLTAR